MFEDLQSEMVNIKDMQKDSIRGVNEIFICMRMNPEKHDEKISSSL